MKIKRKKIENWEKEIDRRQSDMEVKPNRMFCCQGDFCESEKSHLDFVKKFIKSLLKEQKKR